MYSNRITYTLSQSCEIVVHLRVTVHHKWHYCWLTVADSDYEGSYADIGQAEGPTAIEFFVKSALVMPRLNQVKHELYLVK